jgi:hypothetical protein
MKKKNVHEATIKIQDKVLKLRKLLFRQFKFKGGVG